MKKLTLLLTILALSACSQKEPEFLSHFTYDSDEFEKQYKLNKSDWDAAFKFLDQDLKTLEIGQWHQLTETVRGRAQRVFTKESRGFEAHRRTIDVFFVIDGIDRVAISDLDDLQDNTRPYNEEKDVEAYASSSDPDNIILHEGEGVILFPSDAHSPNLCVEVPDSLTLAVVKIPYISK